MALLCAGAACAPRPDAAVESADPADRFIGEMDRAPERRRPPDWAETRRLMARRAPPVGAEAPDFTLATPDGATRITRSKFQAGRPLVLVFGSFT
jgi:hypothetical protein